MNSKDMKATFIVLGIALGILLAIIIPIVIISREQNDKEAFPDYVKIEIKESDVANVSSDSYQTIKRQLENDPYFAREAMISNFYSSNYTSADLKKLLWNFIFSYSLDNRKYVSNFDQKKETFCMRSKYVIEAFKELYDVNITENINYFEGFVDYSYVKGNKYCFYYGNVARDYNNDLLVGIDAISVKDNVVTTNVYLYEYYTTYTSQELNYITNLKNHIRNSNYESANNVVKNYLNGKVTHKQLQFHILNNGKFFKYQILVSKNLDY